MDSSLCDSTLSLSGYGGMPFLRSQYSERIDIFAAPSVVPLPACTILVHKESLRANPESNELRATEPLNSVSALANKIQRLWATIRSMTVDKLDQAAIDAARHTATSKFNQNLQVIDDAHGPHRFCFNVVNPRLQFRAEDFNALDEILSARDGMGASIILRGGDEDKGIQDEFVKVSICKGADGADTNYIILEEVDLDLDQELSDGKRTPLLASELRSREADKPLNWHRPRLRKLSIPN
ncbi:hypothetical protein TWF730_009006 [Orbilia blumenaviensis]|uniref:Uncharacterized protein n=1 Tax=Orbilia blumenaviensis TaxID=1796055 RepID=A0AAV9UYC0_9PEZI